MCYFMGQKVSKDTMIQLRSIEKQLGTLEALKTLHDGFSYGNVPVIVPNGSDDFTIEAFHWEFIPVWIKNWSEMEKIRIGIDPRTGEKKAPIPWLNAKGETLLTGKMFAPAARARRCLFVASHFWEYRHYKPITSKKELSYPYNISLKNKEYFFMAGVWQPWKHNELDKRTGNVITEITNTCVIVTTVANSFMAQIHNTRKRQPTILPEALAAEWISDKLTDERITQLATYQLPSIEMQAYTVAKDFKLYGDPLAPFNYEDLPPLLPV